MKERLITEMDNELTANIERSL